jgi:protein-tyrosine-phosphatase
MAEGFFNSYAPSRYRAISAGIKPASDINPVVIEVMREIGIDISNQKSKEITEDMIRDSYKTVNMDCMNKDSCPTLFLPNILDWNLEDPKDKSIEKVREIRDEINRRVREFVANLKTY